MKRWEMMKLEQKETRLQIYKIIFLSTKGTKPGPSFHLNKWPFACCTFLVLSVKLPNLKVETWPKQLIGYFMLVIVLPDRSQTSLSILVKYLHVRAWFYEDCSFNFIWLIIRCSTLVGSSLTCKYQTIQERLARNKRSSLFGLVKSDNVAKKLMCLSLASFGVV